jgi:hypothetical protein
MRLAEKLNWKGLKDMKEKRKQRSIKLFLQRNEKHLRNTKTLFGGGQLFADFYFRGGLETQLLRKARDYCIYLFIIIVLLPIVLAPCLHSHHVHTPMLLGIS